MGSLVEIEMKFPDWRGKLSQHKQELNLFQAAQIQFNRGMLFDREGNYNGHKKWAPLKYRNGQILSKRGTLRKSIAPFNAKGVAGPEGIVRFRGDTITVGTSLHYARMMNDGTEKMPGGVLRPVRAKALKIPTGDGKFIFRKSAKIPARPFDQWNETDQEEFDVAVMNKVLEIMTRD